MPSGAKGFPAPQELEVSQDFSFHICYRRKPRPTEQSWWEKSKLCTVQTFSSGVAQPSSKSLPGLCLSWVRPGYMSTSELFSELGVVQYQGLGSASLLPLLLLLACAPLPPAQAVFMDNCLGNKQSCPGARRPLHLHKGPKYP